MGRAFYSEYVSHCLKFYVRHPNHKFHSDADKNNWNACEAAFKEFTDSEKEILFYIYNKGDAIPNNVYQIAKAKRIKQDSIWALLNSLEKKVAERRGLV